MLTANLAGRTALVTGASSGFGAHFARVLARAGAKVVVAARRVDALEKLVAEIRDTGGAAQAVALDVTDPAKVEAVIGSLEAVDILVNNAGVTLSKPFAAQTPEDWDFVIGTNLRGAALVAMAAARKMKATGGSIINIASILGLRQAGQLSAYAVSKAGVIQLTKSMALDLARDRIRVNALAPGYFDTELNHDFFQSDAGQTLIKRVPFRRLGKLEDLDGPLLLLASDASQYMTGSVIAVDGGHLVSSL
ncbi:glucose 1-dehydrogenase [Noviherbaspirillum sedimenti]|uniref:Glucose 1-dehydrogenase n=1 Tax=Noviherbaspirillum sedimenti TaxID=2320865 RepID=A0A3A3G110_9BURK|nr:glucose 1-dehydrogenase [Noviherbaspirillum sedimenti]RJG01325.1 glucose 1-dehydrogenase [Noviherbaspirillum sedimenti]